MWLGRRAVRRQVASRVRRAQKGRLRLRLARPATFGPSMSRVTFAPEVLPTLHERRRASERPPWTPASVLRDGEVDRLEPICARFQQAVWRLGRQWHGVHRRATPIKVCRLDVPAIPWHWHQRLAHTDVRSTPPFSDRRRCPIAARGGGARLPAPVGQWGGQRRGYRSNTYRGPLQAAGRGMEAHGASSVGARPGGSHSAGGAETERSPGRPAPC